MPRRRKPDSALIIIDMINALDFPGGAGLLRQALPVARRIARLKHCIQRRPAQSQCDRGHANDGGRSHEFRQALNLPVDAAPVAIE